MDYLFGTGAIAAAAIGSLSDTWGLGTVIQAGALVGLAAVREAAHPKPESAAA